MWKEKVDQAEVGDQVTLKYLDTALKLKRKLFGDADAVGKLAWADDHFGPCSPWDSIYKIELLISKVSGSPNETEKRAWLMGYVHDRVSSGGVEQGEMSVKALSGKGMAHNKGLFDLALLKFDLNCLCL